MRLFSLCAWLTINGSLLNALHALNSHRIEYLCESAVQNSNYILTESSFIDNVRLNPYVLNHICL